MKKKQLRILLAPLDWGLGHVTRCIPLLQHIVQSGHTVIFAGNTRQQEYVKASFPKIEYLQLEGYNVRYSRTKIGLIPKIVSQIPRLRKRIKQEHLWLQQTIATHKIDAVISDNRYGLYSPDIPSVFLTHQLQIQTGYSGFPDSLLRRMHYKFIEKFSRCWVVDTAEGMGLSGNMAHPGKLPQIKTEYIGLLSQCAGKAETPVPDHEFYVLILLSGAEPQRSILADILWKKAIKSDQHIIFVAGSEDATVPAEIPDHISFHKRLSSQDLIMAINAASIVVCRSGYSSLMDLIALNKKAILIPTPGQTEQEYLAKLSQKEKIFMCAQQHNFDLQTSLINASLFSFTQSKLTESFGQYESILDKWLKDLQEA